MEAYSDTKGAPGTAGALRRLHLTIVTGFLGSGKTTFIEHFLRSSGARNTGLIINEIGAVGVDDLVLNSQVVDDTRITLLKNGCICCSGGDDLSNGIRMLHRRINEHLEDGRTPRVIIETSGLADPVPLLQRLMVDLQLRSLTTFAGVVTLVDGANGLRNLADHPLLHRQIAVSDQIIISKTDIAPKSDVAALESAIRKFNGAAPLHDSGTLSSYDEVLDSRLISGGVPSRHLANLIAGSKHAHGEEYGAVVVHGEGPVDWEKFVLALQRFGDKYRYNLLRLKGVLDVFGSSGPTIVNGVGAVFYRPVELSRWPGDARYSAIVVIVSRPTTELEQDLAGLLSPAAE